VLFGYYIISPLSVNFLGNYKVSESVISAPTLRSYVSTITSVVLAAGIVFQLPILVYFLSKVGLVTPGFLKKYRRHSLVVIVTLSAIITPPDVFSQVLVALPLMVLYEIGIMISKRIIKEQDAEMESGKRKAKGKKKKAAARATGDQKKTEQEPETEEQEPEAEKKEPESEEQEPDRNSDSDEEESTGKKRKKPSSKKDQKNPEAGDDETD
jgi:hypothetical protein